MQSLSWGFPSHVASAYAHSMGTVNAPGSCGPCLPSEPQSRHTPSVTHPLQSALGPVSNLLPPTHGRTMFTEHGSVLYPRPRAQSKKSFLSFSKKKKISE